MKNMFLILLFSALVFSSTCHASTVNDFCVADLNGSESPSGYLCKPLNTVRSSDFKYTLRPSSNTPFPPASKVVISQATVNEFPAVNGLKLALERVDIETNGSFVWQENPGGDKILTVVEGEILCGFVTSTSIYLNALKTGDVTVFPKGRFHYIVNNGRGRASAIAAYNSVNPRLQVLNPELSANNDDIIAQTTSLDVHQLKKIMARFTASG